MPQRAIPAVYMRGGTSRALIFHRRDLPDPGPDHAGWNAIFCAALGSPDPGQRQLDGMGGGISSLSKIAVVGPPSRPDADVDYTFAQVEVARAAVGYRGNCGNISSAIGPFAVDEGLVPAAGSRASVVIHNTNTGKLIRASFALDAGQAAVRGDFALDGVAGTGAPVELAFLAPGGAATGKLFPTGRLRDTLELPGLGRIAASLVDAANPCVFVRAAALGLTGRESPAELAADARAMQLFEALRQAASVAMGLVPDLAAAATAARNIPIVGLLAAPAPGSRAHLATRMVATGQPHKASPLTAAMCLAVAAQVPGALAAEIIGERLPEAAEIVLEHPSGLLPVAARVAVDGANSLAREAVVYRTARRLMEGRVLIPGDSG